MRLPAPARWLVRLLPAPHDEEVGGDLMEVHARRLRAGATLRAYLATSVEALRIAVALGVAAAFEGLRRFPVSLPEIRLAFRVTARHPVLSASAVAALTVAIGLSTSMFTVASGLVWSDLPFPGGNRFVDLDFRTAEHRYSVPPPIDGYRAFRDEASFVEDVGAYRTAQLTLVEEGTTAEGISVARITPRSFNHFGIAPVMGRTLVPDDAGGASEDVVVLRADLWRTRWNADASVVGRTIQLGGRARTVVGIMPGDFGFPVQSQAWIPLDEETLGGSAQGAHPRVEAYGILAEGASMDAAEGQLQALLDRTGAPEGDPLVLTIHDFTRAGVGGSTQVLVLVVALLLILALVASNVANLILTRTMGRWSELEVRSTLGASRGRLVSQVAFEVLIIVGLAATLGLWTSQRAMDLLVGAVDDLPFWADLSPSWTVIAFVILASAVSCAIAGVLPALRATSGKGAPGLQGKGASAQEIRFGRFSSTMVLVQVSMCVALISGALVLGEALQRYLSRSATVPGDEILTARVYFDPPMGDGGAWVISEPFQLDSIRAVYARVSTAVGALPEVETVAFTTDLPGNDAGLRRLEVDGVTPRGTVEVVSHASVSPGFFETLGVEPLVGRDFAEGADNDEIIVNQPFVDRVLRGRNALGQRVRFPGAGTGDPAPWYRIVGVVADLDMSPADPEYRAGVYRPIDVSNLFYAVARTRQGVAMDEAGTSIVSAATSVDAEVRVDEILPLSQADWAPRALLGALMAGFGGVGLVTLLLSLIGLYAVMSYSVTRRTREIGIRVALGSPRAAVLRLVLRRAIIQISAGAALGLLLTTGLIMGMRVLPIRVASAGFWPGTLTAALMLLAGLAASWIPARRVLRVSPLEALRSR